MRVVCLREVLTREELAQIDPLLSPERTGFGVQEGREYLALALAFWRAHAWVCVDTHPDAPELAAINYVPMFLFRVSDQRIPSVWVVHQNEHGNVLVGPPSFHAPHYVEDVIDRNPPAIRDDFYRVVAQLQHEDVQPRG